MRLLVRVRTRVFAESGKSASISEARTTRTEAQSRARLECFFVIVQPIKLLIGAMAARPWEVQQELVTGIQGFAKAKLRPTVTKEKIFVPTKEGSFESTTDWVFRSSIHPLPSIDDPALSDKARNHRQSTLFCWDGCGRKDEIILCTEMSRQLLKWAAMTRPSLGLSVALHAVFQA